MDLHWLNIVPKVIGFLAFLVPLLVLIDRRIDSLARILGDQDDLPYYYKLLADSPWRSRYRETLGRALEQADAFFGKSLGWRSLNVCWLIAFAYPFALFLLTWALGGPHTLGGVNPC